jgi:hypothetical protein
MNHTPSLRPGIELEIGDYVGYRPALGDPAIPCPTSGFCAGLVTAVLAPAATTDGPALLVHLLVHDSLGREFVRLGVFVLADPPGSNATPPYAVPKWMLFLRAVRVRNGATIGPGMVLADQLAAAELAAQQSQTSQESQHARPG